MNKQYWQKVRLGDITEYVNRGIPPVYTQDTSGTVVINQKCIRDGQVNFDLSRLTDELARQIPHAKLVQPYDILINSTGTGTVGRVGQIVNLTQRATVDSHVTIVRPKKDEVDPTYLGIWLKAKQDELEVLAEGSSNQVELSRDKISNLKVILPSIKTQKKIADILLTIDETIEKTEEIVQKVESLKQGIISELIGKQLDKKTNSSWNTSKLADVCNLITDGKHGDCQNEQDSGYYFISSKDVHDGVIDYTNARQITRDDFEDADKRTKLDLDDLVMTNSGTIGRMAIVDNIEKTRKTTFQKSVAIIKPKKDIVSSKYLFYYFICVLPSLQIASSGSAQKNLLLKDLRSLQIPIPDKIEQEKIVSILMEIDKKIKNENLQRKQLVLLKNGLMQDIFSRKVQID